jgi:hypothetical protein
MNNGDFESEWRFHSVTSSSSHRVILDGTTIHFPRDFFGAPEGLKIPFPIEDLSVPRMNVSVPAGSFPDSYQIRSNPPLPNDHSMVLFWVSPKVGIVKVYAHIINTIDGPRRVEAWNLVSYTK